MQIKIRLWGRQTILSVNSQKIRKKLVYGYTNRCKDGKYVITLDYDRIEPDWLVEELKHLQQMFSLSTLYVFSSSEGSYHVVCLDKVNLSTLLLILQNSSVDPNYVRIPLHWGKKLWTLRLTSKDPKSEIRYVTSIKNPTHNMDNRPFARETSLAHTLLLNKMFNLNIPVGVTDEIEDVILARYPI